MRQIMFFAVFEIYCVSYLTVMAHLKFGSDAFQVLKIIMQIVLLYGVIQGLQYQLGLLWVLHTKSLQLCPTFCDTMDCSSPGSSVNGDSSGKNTGVGCHFQGVNILFSNQKDVSGKCHSLDSLVADYEKDLSGRSLFYK